MQINTKNLVYIIKYTIGWTYKINFSSKHKNWIINNGCSGSDINKLIKDAQKILYNKFSVELKEEVDII
mgnify:CR=1 FL=1